MKKIFLLFITPLILLATSCTIPSNIQYLVVKSGLNNLKEYSDIHRNYHSLKGLCVNLIGFKEGRLNWNMLLVFNPKAPRGPFWFLPHDNENSAFSSAVYATHKYGGGFLSVLAGGNRYFKGQDPNRNFSDSSVRICSKQLAPSPIYTSVVFSIINYFRGAGMPYLALHNNTNGGGITALKSSKYTKSFLAYSREQVKKGVGLSDEDSLVYIAGSSFKPPAQKISNLLGLGLNVKYEIVNSNSNDCSMSNYVVIGRSSSNYYNIEAQHGKTATQKRMVDLLMHLVR